MTIVCFFAVTIFHSKLSPLVCKILGMTLHTSILTTFGWMMLQAVLVYKNLVVVFVSANNFLWKHSGPVIRESLLVVMLVMNVCAFSDLNGVSTLPFLLLAAHFHRNYSDIYNIKPYHT